MTSTAMSRMVASVIRPPFYLSLLLAVPLSGPLQGCDSRTKAPTGTESPVAKVPALTVGANVFSQSDIRIRERVIATRSAVTEGLTEGAYAQLLQGFLFVEVLSAMGHPITEELLDREIRRIDESTHDPQGLLTLKEACGGGNSPAYRRIGILPDFANRVFSQQVYPQAKELHADQLAEAEKVLRNLCAAAPRANEAAQTPNSSWQRSVCLFSPEFGFQPESKPGDPPVPSGNAISAGLRWQRFERDHFATLPPGKFCSTVVDMDDRFVLLRWTAWEDEAHRLRKVEQVWLPKRSSSEYFSEKTAAIPVWIGDPKIAESIRQNVSWARRLAWRQP